MGKINLCLDEEYVQLGIEKWIPFDFEWLTGCKNYYPVDTAMKGIDTFFTMFENRLYKREPSDNIQVLFIDEYPSLLLSISSKKEQEELKGRIARLLNLSRALKIIVICAMQRPFAELFTNGCRDSFNIRCMMGANSKEAIAQSMNEYKDVITPCPVGVGYCTVNDMNLKKIRAVMPTDTAKLHRIITEAVSR